MLSRLLYFYHGRDFKNRATINFQANHLAAQAAELSDKNESLKNEIKNREKLDEERKRLIYDLELKIKQINTLQGLIPICSNCKKIRDDKGYWNHLEQYILKNILRQCSVMESARTALKFYTGIMI